MRVPATNPLLDTYAAVLADFHDRHVTHEGAVRIAFHNLLAGVLPSRWTLVGEQTVRGIRPDGIVRDEYNLIRGYWEAKDTADDLDEEIRKKILRGYPLTNIIFEDTRRAVLY